MTKACRGHRRSNQPRARSWTPMSRADRNRWLRGESPRVALMKSTWWSPLFAAWDARLRRGAL